MLSRDLIATVVKTFSEEVDNVRDGRYAPLYLSYFNREREWFFQAQTAEITTFLMDDPIHKIEMLTELLYRDARQLTDAELQGILYRKIMALYDVIDTRSAEFSLARMERMTELKQYLS